MIGEIELNEDDLKSAIVGRVRGAGAAGINSGLSAGLMYTGLPRTKMTRGEGTPDDPDKLKILSVDGPLELREMSLTNIPRLTNAGILRRLDATIEPEPEPMPTWRRCLVRLTPISHWRATDSPNDGADATRGNSEYERTI